ncbi:DUF6428 family protein [uncultured Roseobacter sp.]|uniref:DUF6428 family protein n=2 Tax=uncultured Roseobacter sp. TaxID=114847 RepID=UPI0026114892|nr:DUF6428 family protein [uncultured Roseobacter sp.]
MKGFAVKTLSGLLNDLQLQDPALPLVFETKDGEISPGYHVTELRHSASKGIDCGGNIESWQEAKLQLLDGRGAKHMSVGKFRSIVSKSLSAMPELKHVSLRVEFGNDNTDLCLMSLESPKHRGDRVVIGLGNTRAVCKPAEKAWRGVSGSGQCCGSEEVSAKPSSCCSTSKVPEGVSSCCA